MMSVAFPLRTSIFSTLGFFARVFLGLASIFISLAGIGLPGDSIVVNSCMLGLRRTVFSMVSLGSALVGKNDSTGTMFALLDDAIKVYRFTDTRLVCLLNGF